MLTLPELGPYATIALAVAICAIMSYGVTQGLKMLILWWDQTHHDRWWFNVAMRLIAVGAGAIVGYMLMSSMVGLFIGACSGVLNTTIVMIIKSKLANFQPEAGDQQQPTIIQDIQTTVVKPNDPQS